MTECETMEKVCARLGITASCELTEMPKDREADFPSGTAWKVTLRFRGRKMTVPFYQGSAHSKEPSAADVMGCLMSDVLGVRFAEDFESWCAEYGFDSDSRKAERMYKEIEKQSRALSKFVRGMRNPHSKQADDDWEALSLANY